MGGTLLVIGANVVVLFGFFLYFRRRIDRALQTENILRDIRDEVDKMIVDLNQTTDRNVGIVEDHLAQLSARIAEADRRIVVLKRENAKVHTAETVYTRLRSTSPPTPANVEKSQTVDSQQEPEKKKSAREEALALYRSGMEAREIAAKLNKTIGEVELIISLGTHRTREEHGEG